MNILTTRRDVLVGGLAMTTVAGSGLAAVSEKKFRIAVPGDYENLASRAAWHTLGPDVEVVFFHKPFDSEHAAVKALQDFDALALMRERTPISRAMLTQLPKLKLIVFSGPSNATLDYNAAIEHNITVCYATAVPSGTPPTPAPTGGSSPAELTLALMMACAWHIPAATTLIKNGGWAFQPGIPMRGKTLGIVGYGNLGREVAKYGIALGMNVLGFSRSLTDDKAQADGVTRAELETLLRTSDVVSIHLPLNASTTGMVGSKEIGWMKDGAFLINTARAPIVDEAAMIAALRTRKIAMAGLDVYNQEPLPKNHPLLQLPNVVMTPHIGYVTEGSIAGMYAAEIDVLAAFRQGTVKNRYAPKA